MAHELADFDAAASLAAASLVYPERIPVLPKRLKHRLLEFYETYKKELPFRKNSRISGVKIHDLILTDTQILPVSPAILSNVRVSVIDHHPLQEYIPSGWNVHIDEVGACATLWTEKLKKNGIRPKEIIATLMLMGIYDDTGQFTFGGTTPRDLNAAAWLLECGADLDEAVRWIDPPLNDTQIRLRDRLLENCAVYPLLMSELTICEADIRDLNGEFSPAARNVQELLDPELLIVMLHAKNGIRLICRGKSDRVDAGRLMRHFHGGGHKRASAGFVPVCSERELQSTADEIREEILGLLDNDFSTGLTDSFL